MTGLVISRSYKKPLEPPRGREWFPLDPQEGLMVLPNFDFRLLASTKRLYDFTLRDLVCGIFCSSSKKLGLKERIMSEGR